ncbi:MAG: sugar fermentation stimulation protein A [Candidatus Azotimanducaceae bacterium]
MKFATPLQSGKLVRRYKRFLADIESAEGKEFTIHCPNTGSMKNCAEPGFDVWFSHSDNPKRKYANTWELAKDHHGNMIGINANLANKLVKEAILSGVIVELAGYDLVQSEVKYGVENSRIDLLLTGENRPKCYVEIKSVTLLDNHPDRDTNGKGRGLFPDAVSTRGQKHLRELAEVARHGERAVLVFCVQHSGIVSVAAAAEIDPEYAASLIQARQAGVEVLVYGCDLSPTEIRVATPLVFVSPSVRPSTTTPTPT